MARIYRTSDRIRIKIDGLIVTVSPLNYHQKAEIETYLIGFARGDVSLAAKAMVSAVKYSLKDIEGVEDADGKKYELEFEDGVVSDDCVSDLLNLDISTKLQSTCTAFLHGVPKSFHDQNGEPLEGVEFLDTRSESPNE